MEIRVLLTGLWETHCPQACRSIELDEHATLKELLSDLRTNFEISDDWLFRYTIAFGRQDLNSEMQLLQPDQPLKGLMEVLLISPIAGG